MKVNNYYYKHGTEDCNLIGQWEVANLSEGHFNDKLTIFSHNFENCCFAFGSIVITISTEFFAFVDSLIFKTQA